MAGHVAALHHASTSRGGQRAPLWLTALLRPAAPLCLQSCHGLPTTVACSTTSACRTTVVCSATTTCNHSGLQYYQGLQHHRGSAAHGMQTPTSAHPRHSLRVDDLRSSQPWMAYVGCVPVSWAQPKDWQMAPSGDPFGHLNRHKPKGFFRDLGRTLGGEDHRHWEHGGSSQSARCLHRLIRLTTAKILAAPGQCSFGTCYWLLLGKQ